MSRPPATVMPTASEPLAPPPVPRRPPDLRGVSFVLLLGADNRTDKVVGRTLARKRVALEDPVYAQARLMFDNHGASVLGLPLDPFAAGVDLDAWERAIAAFRPALLYAITSYQNPTGNSYATHELEAMLAWSGRHGVGLLEDDWGSDMLSGSDVRPTLRALGGREGGGLAHRLLLSGGVGCRRGRIRPARRAGGGRPLRLRCGS